MNRGEENTHNSQISVGQNHHVGYPLVRSWVINTNSDNKLITMFFPLQSCFNVNLQL
jgi:hypothetical protein